MEWFRVSMQPGIQRGSEKGRPNSRSGCMPAWKIWFVPTAGFILAMSLAACVSPLETEQPVAQASQPESPSVPSPTLTPQSTIEPEEGGTIHMWVAWEPDKLAALYDVIDAFEAGNPGVHFIVSYVPTSSMITALGQAQSSGQAPTLILAPSEIGLALEEQQVLIDLRDLIDASIRQTIQPLAWTQVETQSTTRGLPFALAGNVLYRNTNLAPAPENQVESFIATAREIFLENRVGATIDLGFDNTAPFLSACGARLFDQSGEFILLQSEAACWFELLTLFRSVGVSTINSDQDRQFFLEGQSAWMIDTSSVASELAEAVELENITVDPWPIYAQTGDSLAGYLWTENLYLLTEATFVDREITWSFMRYLVSEEVQDELGQVLGVDFLPVSVDFQSSDSFQSRLMEALLTNRGRPVRSDLAIYQEPLEEASLNVALRGANPNAAYNVAVDEIQRELAAASSSN